MDREEALKRIKEWILSPEEEEVLFTVLPELKEDKDEKIRKAIINVFESHKDYEVYFGVFIKDILAWLKKQSKENSNQNKWKPSKRQMEVLEDFLFHIPKEVPEKGVLVSLHQDLKKLIE